MAVIAFIHARGGSKRCPRKNVRKIAGVPLIVHTILQAQAHPLIDHIVVSTDDVEIADIAVMRWAERLIRPAELCTDDAKEFESWKFGIKELNLAKEDIFVNLPCTCPLRSDEDITNTIGEVVDGHARMAFTIKKSREFPVAGYQRMMPQRFSVVGACYAATPEFIHHNDSIFGEPASMVEMPDERTLDIDTEHDFRVAKLLMEHA